MLITAIIAICLFLLICYLFSNSCSFCKNVTKAIDPLTGPEFETKEEIKKEEVEVKSVEVKSEVVQNAVGAKNPVKKEFKQAVKKIAKKASKKSETKKELKDAQKKKGYRKK